MTYPFDGGVPRKADPCALCGKPLSASERQCPACGARHHRRCFKKNLGCAACGVSSEGLNVLPGAPPPRRAIRVRRHHGSSFLTEWVHLLRRPMGAVFAASVGVIVLQTLFLHFCPFVYHPTLTAMVIVAVPALWFVIIDVLSPRQDDVEDL